MSSQTTPQFVTKNATSTSAFTNSIGVNIHLGAPAYSNVAEVTSALAYLGIDHVRENLLASARVQSNFEVLAAAGYKFDYELTAATNGTVDIATFVAMLKSDEAKFQGSISAIEGPNEVNNWRISLDGGTTTSIANAAIVQQQLYTAVKADAALSSIPVYNTTIGSTDASQFAQLGNLSAYTDYANEHAYVMSTTNISAGLDYLLQFGQSVAPGKPVVITEAGYTTIQSAFYNGVSETVEAKYTLDTLMDAYQKGVSQTFLYELLDESNIDANSTQSHYGLFHSDGTPKLAATAIHNLTQILDDSGASASTATGSLTYALSNAPATSHDMVFAKSNGNIDLVLWAEPILWNQTTQSAVAATPSTVTVTFAQTEGLIRVYDPLVGNTPIANYANVNSIQVTISDHPLVIEVTPVIKAVAAPIGGSTNSTTTQNYVNGVLASETTTYLPGFADVSDTKIYTTGVLTRETVLHADNSKDVYIFGVQNQSYASEHDFFDATGTLIWTIRAHADGTFGYVYNLAPDGTKTTDQYNAAGVIVSETVLHADGSSDVKTYTNGTIANETITYAAGSAIAADTLTYTNGLLATDIVRFASGAADAFEVKTYNAAGALTRDDFVHRDNSEDVYSYGVTNQNYVAGHDVYNSARVLTATTHTHADGSLAYTYSLAPDGTKTTDQYDATGKLTLDTVVHTDGSSDTKTYSGGVLTGDTLRYAAGSPVLSDSKVYAGGSLISDTIVHADKSRDVFLSGVQNKTYVAEHDVYNAAGVLTSTVRTHTDGSPDYTYNLASNGTKTTDQYNAAGVLQSDSVVHADGSSEVKTYANGSLASDIVRYASGSADLSDSKTFTAGVLTNDTVVHGDKSRDVYDSNVVGKTYVADHLHYAPSGQLTQADYTNADGSHTVTAYTSGVSLTSTAGVADGFTSSGAGGDNFVFNSNFGKDTITGFHAGDAANHDTISIDSSLVSDFSHLVLQQVNHDTLLTVTASDTILIKNVLPSALTAADFQFVAHHDWMVG